MRLLSFILTTLVVLALLVDPAAAEARVALVIGNSSYKATTSLDNPVNDAELVATTLARQGFDLTEHVNADLKQMKRALQAFSVKVRRAGRDAVFVVFYAGHGVQVRGLNYLIPVDAEIDTEEGVDVEAIRADSVVELVANAGARLNIVIPDACRNNPFRGFRSPGRGLAQIEAPTGTLVAFSTAPGRARWPQGRQQSLYRLARQNCSGAWIAHRGRVQARSPNRQCRNAGRAGAVGVFLSGRGFLSGGPACRNGALTEIAATDRS